MAADSAAPPRSDIPVVDPLLEIRFAIVLYGGVSLAIYINGVAQELLSLVRATAPSKRDGGNAVPALIPDGELCGAERVYRDLGRRLHRRLDDTSPVAPGAPIRTQFIVDVLSGTSAGGINGVFLAKALANNQSLDELRQLWVREGDLDLLLHDSNSKRGMPEGYRVPRDPTSLLNSQRMYRKLAEALGGLDRSNPGGHERPSPLVDELDLFVTATDLFGRTVPLQLTDRQVFERTHRAVHHFVYGSKKATGKSRNDFGPVENRFLAHAARCTSSFPFAFEPMSLRDVRRFDDAGEAVFRTSLQDWERFYRDYLTAPEVAGSVPDAADSDYSRRFFGDGGYLDNKPFSYAIDTLAWRRSVGRVDRRLVYVEPSPEHPEREVLPPERPDAIQNLAAAASSIPRNETIREDVERVRERNRLIERIRRATREIEQDVDAAYGDALPEWKDTPTWMALGLKDMIAAYKGSFASYHRLKVAQVTSDLAEAVTRAAGLREDSQEAEAARALVSAWRQNNFDPDLKDGGAPRTENAFLVEFDLSYRLRRISFVESRIAELLAFDKYSADALKRFMKLHPEHYGKKEDGEPPVEPLIESPEWLARLETVLRTCKAGLSDEYVRLRKRGRLIRERTPRNLLRRSIERLNIRREDLASLLRKDAPRDRRDVAKQLLEHQDRKALVNAAASRLSKTLKKVFTVSSDACKRLLEPPADAAMDWASPEHIAKRYLNDLYKHFDAYDMVLFPIQLGTPYGEGVEVETIRISPEDANGLIAERDETGKRTVSKLAGTSVGNFGGFLHQRWRQSDILWGRLDAAEILIESLLRGRPEDRGPWVARAQAAIVCDAVESTTEPKGEKMGVEQAREMLVECAIRTDSRKPEPQIIERFANRLREYLPDGHPHARLCLETGALLDLYERKFREEQTSLPARTALQFAARATTITGRLLDGVADRYAVLRKNWIFLMIAFGRAVWLLVEIATPRTMLKQLVTYWMALLYAFSILLIIVAPMLGAPLARPLGWKSLLVLAVFDLMRRTAGYVMPRPRRLRPLALIVFAFAGLLLVLGGRELFGVLLPVWGTVLGQAWSNVRATITGRF